MLRPLFISTMSLCAPRLRLFALQLLLALVLSRTSLADLPGVGISRVSGCMDVGLATDNCTGDQLITIAGSGFLLIPQYKLWLDVEPDVFQSLYQASTDRLNVTNTSIVAQLLPIIPSPLWNQSKWEYVSVGIAFSDANFTTPFGPAFRYAVHQPPYIQELSAPRLVVRKPFYAAPTRR